MPYSFLFPAYAGVILTSMISFLSFLTFPRLCGGDPVPFGQYKVNDNFSPPMRG